MEKLVNFMESLLNSNDELEISNKWIVKNLTAKEIDLPFYNLVNITHLEFARNKDWTKEDFLIDVDDLKSKVASIANEIKNLKSKIKVNEVQSNEVQSYVLPELITGGLIANGPVYVDQLEVSEMNGVEVDEILNDSFR